MEIHPKPVGPGNRRESHVHNLKREGRSRRIVGILKKIINYLKVKRAIILAIFTITRIVVRIARWFFDD